MTRAEPDVSIRPLELDDAASVQRYASDERVAASTTIPSPYPEDGGETFVSKCLESRRNGSSYAFAITADGAMIGVVEVGINDRENHVGQCDYAIASSHWGRGITTRAVALALEFAFGELQLETVTSACLMRNPASGRVLQKNGFTETGAFAFSCGKFQDEPARRFRLTRQEWLGFQSGRHN